MTNKELLIEIFQRETKSHSSKEKPILFKSYSSSTEYPYGVYSTSGDLKPYSSLEEAIDAFLVITNGNL